MRWLWLIGALFCFIGGVAIWYAFSNPTFVFGLLTLAVTGLAGFIIHTLLPVILAHSAERDKVTKEEAKTGEHITIHEPGTPYDHAHEGHK